MNTYVTVNENGQVLFHRFAWTADDMFTAQCLGFDVNPSSGYIISDISKTKRQAMLSFMKEVTPDFYYGNSEHRTNVMNAIKQWYAYHKNKYENNLFPRLKYTRNLYAHQNDTLISGITSQHNLFALDMGLGKAQCVDEPVMTPDGFVRIGDINVDDFVIGSDGNKTRVKGVYPQGLLDIYRVTFTDGSSTLCCSNHLWNVQTPVMKNRGQGYVTVKTSDLINDLTQSKSKNTKWYIPIVKPINIDKKEVLIDPYIIGCLIGDGGFSQRSVYISNVDGEIIDEFKKHFDLSRPYRCTYRIRVNKENNIIKLLGKYGLMGRKSEDKFIPQDYLINDIQTRLSILQGLLDTDGYVSKDGTVQYYTVSEYLMEDVKYIVQSLGGTCRITNKQGSYRHNGAKVRCKKVYTITINLPGFELFRLMRKKYRMRKVVKYKPSRGIVSIEFEKKCKAVCISVEAEDSLYVTRDMIVTHNTITTSSLSKMFNYGRTLIICPALVKWNWMRDMSGWGYNNMYWTIYDAKPSKTKRAFIERFVVVNFETIEKHFNSITADNIDHIIIDECHYIKNHKSGRYKNVEKVVRKFPNARVTLLSGTPFTNRINDMFAYLKLCNHPLGGNYKEFLDRYTDYSQGSRGTKIRGSKNIEELKLRISNFMIRKKTEECIDLPPLLINNYYFDLEDEEFRRQYDEILGDIVAQEEERDQLEGNEKRQKTIAMNGNLTKLNRLVTMTKIKDAIKLIDSINEEGRKAIVFSGFTGPLDLLLKHYGRKAVKIDGSVDSHKRDLIVEEFKNNEEVTVFLGNNKAAGVGINLVNASDVILLNLPWTPDDIEQPFKRAHRIGQNRTVNVYILLAMQTVDEYIYNLITEKAGDINKLIDNEDTKGVIKYDSIPGDLFRELIDNYRSRHNMAVKPKEKGNLIRV